MVESVSDRGSPVDLITLQEHLKAKDVPPEVSGMEFVRELIAECTDLCQREILCADRAGKVDLDDSMIKDQ